MLRQPSSAVLNSFSPLTAVRTRPQNVTLEAVDGLCVGTSMAGLTLSDAALVMPPAGAPVGEASVSVLVTVADSLANGQFKACVALPNGGGVAKFGGLTLSRVAGGGSTGNTGGGATNGGTSTSLAPAEIPAASTHPVLVTLNLASVAIAAGSESFKLSVVLRTDTCTATSHISITLGTVIIPDAAVTVDRITVPVSASLRGCCV